MSYEAKKIFSVKWISILVLLWGISSVTLCVRLNSIRNGNDTHLIETLSSHLEGCVTEEKYNYIVSLYKEMETVFALEAEMQKQYLADEIDVEQYLAYRAEYREFQEKENAINTVYKAMVRAYEGNYEYKVTLYYDTYVSHEIKAYFLAMSLFLLYVLIVSTENPSLNLVIMATKCGRAYIKRQKNMLGSICNFVVVTLFCATDFLLLLAYDKTRCLFSPVNVLTDMRNCGSRIRVLTLFVGIYFAKLLLSEGIKRGFVFWTSNRIK